MKTTIQIELLLYSAHEKKEKSRNEKKIAYLQVFVFGSINQRAILLNNYICWYVAIGLHTWA